MAKLNKTTLDDIYKQKFSKVLGTINQEEQSVFDKVIGTTQFKTQLARLNKLVEQSQKLKQETDKIYDQLYNIGKKELLFSLPMKDKERYVPKFEETTFSRYEQWKQSSHWNKISLVAQRHIEKLNVDFLKLKIALETHKEGELKDLINDFLSR